MSDTTETKIGDEPQATPANVTEVPAVGGETACAGEEKEPTCMMTAKAIGMNAFIYLVDKNGFSALVPVHKIDQIISEPGANMTTVFANGKAMSYHSAEFIEQIAYALSARNDGIIVGGRTPVPIIADDHRSVLEYWAKKAEEREPCKCETIGELIARVCKAADEGGLKVAREPVVKGVKEDRGAEKQAQSPGDWVVEEGDLAASARDGSHEYCSSTSTATEVTDEESDGEEGIDFISLDKLTPEMLRDAGVMGVMVASPRGSKEEAE